MSELYYNNLTGFQNVAFLMKDVYYGLGPYHKFTRNILYHLRDKVIFLKAKIIDPPFAELQILLDDGEFNIVMQKTQTGFWILFDDNYLPDDSRQIEQIFDSPFFYLEKPYLSKYGDFRGDRTNVIASFEKIGAVCIDKQLENEEIYHTPNTYQIKVVLQALNRLQDKPSPHHSPLIRLFEKSKDLIDWPDFIIQNLNNYYFLMDDTLSGIQEQRNFVNIALNTPDFAILDGPPGTGKTTVICEIILQEIMKGRRVMVVASTHIAVDNVIERLIKHPIGKNYVLPVRIGSEHNISEEIKPYTYKRLKITELNRIKKFLRKLNNRTDAQESLHQTLQGSNSVNVIDDYILNHANLVCGTTIGILQFPEIKNLSRESPKALFDLMILDEASKTPFSEFLVPALYAKRWIITGDPKQLSPYVDPDEVKEVLKASIQEFDAENKDLQATIPFVQALSRYKRPQIIICKENEEIERYRIQYNDLIEYGDYELQLCIVDDFENTSIGQIEKELWRSDIIVISEEKYTILGDILPPDGNIRIQNSIIESRKEIENHVGELNRTSYGQIMKFGEIINDKLEYDWGYQMGYRLGRKFELRQTPDAQNKYNFEIQTLFPSFIENISHEKLENELYLLRKVFFPSVLETLIEGFERTGNQDRGSALTDGLPIEALQKRLVTLKYQHRMHPDISEFPREQIYQTLSLLDGAAILNKRMYWRGGIRSRWVHTRANYPCKTSNSVEVGRIRELLQEFEKWTTNRDPANGKYWEVAILSFYRDQEKLLRKMLQRYFKQSSWRTFTRGQLKVDVCTVDRFQGHEADLVILSMVRNRGVGFLDNINRLNVAITRPRYERIIVGDHTHFKKCNNEMLRNLAEHCKPEREYRRK